MQPTYKFKLTHTKKLSIFLNKDQKSMAYSHRLKFAISDFAQ